MSKIHISIGDGQSYQYEEHQVLAMLQQETLSPNAYFWKEGMAEWQPLSTLVPSPAAAMSAAPPVARLLESPLAFTKDPLGLTQTLKVMLWIHLGTVVVSLGLDFMQLNLARSGSVTLESAEANDFRQMIMGLIYLAVYIATAIIFMKWIYRANLNCRGFGATDMKDTPGWSIGWYFIPIMNLFRPFQAMKEIWMVSADPVNWRTQKTGALLGWWWALWLLSNFLGQAVFRMSMEVDSLESLERMTIVSIVHYLVAIPLAFVAISLVSTIIGLQTKLIKGRAS